MLIYEEGNSDFVLKLPVFMKSSTDVSNQVKSYRIVWKKKHLLYTNRLRYDNSRGLKQYLYEREGLLTCICPFNLQEEEIIVVAKRNSLFFQ